MATYAIGDVQGCHAALQMLIARIQFDPAKDRLWFVGDLVNRGPDSLNVLRYIKELGETAVVVLGNHDLFLLAIAEGIAGPRRKDTIHDVLVAPDRDALLHWLRHQPLLYRQGQFVMVHAGLLPQWTVPEAEKLAADVETILRGNEYSAFLRAIFQEERRQWSTNLCGMAQSAAVTHVFTRLRICTEEGRMDFMFKGPPEETPSGYLPWFDIPNRRSSNATVVCGHWSAMGLRIRQNLLALDSGCVWGRQLAAIRLEDRQLFGVECKSCA
ncbi:MAG: symmetrical bis(5'-nucleosyl)-tetraphosphatase [Nitrospiraceae bacterium]